MPTVSSIFRGKLAIALGLAIAFLLLYLTTIDWPFGIIDSPILLAQAVSYSPAEYFFEPLKYQFLTYNNFTPWVTLSWDIDYTLFGFEAQGFRVHHLLSLAVLTGVIYLILFRTTQSAVNAGIFTFAIITLPGTFEVADDLINRHYLEGMIFSLLSFYFATSYIKNQSTTALLASIVFYALSTLAKEVYLPLPGILFFLFPGGLRKKILLVSPYAMVLLGYLVWRFYMLSGSGGYSTGTALPNLLEQPQVYLLVTQKIITSLLASPAASILTLLIFCIALAASFRHIPHSRKMAALTGAIGVALPLLALLPILSVGFFAFRWLFAPTVCLMMFLAYLCHTSKSQALRAIVYVVILVCSLIALSTRTTSAVFIGGKGAVPRHILLSQPDRYISIPRFSEMVARGYSVWVNIARLHSGNWGTLTISEPGQRYYHDLNHRTPILVGRKGKHSQPKANPDNMNLDLLNDVSYNRETGKLLLNFSKELKDKACLIYFFAKDNGFSFSSASCEQWHIQYRELKYLLRMSGYNLTDISVAVWSTDDNNRIYSKPYALRELINLDEIEAGKSL